MSSQRKITSKKRRDLIAETLNVKLTRRDEAPLLKRAETTEGDDLEKRIAEFEKFIDAGVESCYGAKAVPKGVDTFDPITIFNSFFKNYFKAENGEGDDSRSVELAVAFLMTMCLQGVGAGSANEVKYTNKANGVFSLSLLALPDRTGQEDINETDVTMRRLLRVGSILCAKAKSKNDKIFTQGRWPIPFYKRNKVTTDEMWLGYEFAILNENKQESFFRALISTLESATKIDNSTRISILGRAVKVVRKRLLLHNVVEEKILSYATVSGWATWGKAQVTQPIMMIPGGYEMSQMTQHQPQSAWKSE